MYITFRARLRAVMAAMALVPAMAFASMVTVGGTDDDVGVGSAVTQQRAGHLSWAARPLSVPVVSLGASMHTDHDVIVLLPPAVVLRNPLLVNLSGGADLALWNFVAALQSWRRSDSFEWGEAGIPARPRIQLAADPLSVVPLPPVMWLFVTGVLGLAGIRVTGLSGEGRRAASKAPLRSTRSRAWGAVPA